MNKITPRPPRRDVLDYAASLLANSTLIPLQPCPDQIRPIAVGTALRRLVTKTLLRAAIDDTRDLLAPEQLANGVPSGLNAIVHDSRMLIARHGCDPNFVLVSVDASYAFNSFSRQAMINKLTLQTPSLAHFLNIIYGRTVPDLVLPSSPRVLLKSLQGTQQGDPAGMLLFSLALQPLITRISRECNLSLNRWYADDGTLIGTIPEVTQALIILKTSGPDIGVFDERLEMSRISALHEPTALQTMTHSFPLQITQVSSIALLSAPLGTGEYIKEFLGTKITSVSDSLKLLDDISDTRVRFHMHRVTGSVCKVEHVFRLTPPAVSLPLAVRFDDLQRDAYSRVNDVPLSHSMSTQIGLPLRLGVYGFTPLTPFVHASYAASLFESATIRVQGPANPSIYFYRNLSRRHLVRVFAPINPEISHAGCAIHLLASRTI